MRTGWVKTGGVCKLLESHLYGRGRERQGDREGEEGTGIERGQGDVSPAPAGSVNLEKRGLKMRWDKAGFIPSI